MFSCSCLCFSKKDHHQAKAMLCGVCRHVSAPLCA